MNRQHQMNDLLLQGIIGNMPLQTLLNQISAEFDITIYFCDLFGRVLFGRDTDKFHLYFQDVRPAEIRNGTPFYIEKGKIDNNQYFVLSAPGTPSNRIALIAEYDIGDLEFLEYIGESLLKTYRYYMGNNAAPITSNSHFTDLLAKELLLGDDDIAEKLILQTSSIRWMIKAPYRTVCFLTNEKNPDLAAVSQLIVSQFASPYIQVSGNFILLFLYGVKENEEHRLSIHDELIRFCDRHDLICCVSSEFAALRLRQAHLSSVKKLLPICKHLGSCDRVFYADDYYCEQMILQAYSHLEEQSLHLTAIDYLERADRDHGTSYLQTLECYLNNQMNAAAASRELFIDRTTLKYRLDRINNMIHVNIYNPQTILALKLGLIFRKVEAAYNANKQTSDRRNL